MRSCCFFKRYKISFSGIQGGISASQALFQKGEVHSSVLLWHAHAKLVALKLVS